MKKTLTFIAAIALAIPSYAGLYIWGFTNQHIAGVSENARAFLYLGTVRATKTAFDFSEATLVASSGRGSDYLFGDFSYAADSELVTATSGQEYSLILLDGNTSTEDIASYSGRYILVNGEGRENGLKSVEGTSFVDMFNPICYAQFSDLREIDGDEWVTMSPAKKGFVISIQ